MAEYKVVEMFTSINGEGTKAGQLAVFVRFQGCNLNCSFCDTKWANEIDAPYQLMNEEQIVQKILDAGVKNVTLTGGEPLMQKNIQVLLERLGQETKQSEQEAIVSRQAITPTGQQSNLYIEIETNGSMSLASYKDKSWRPAMTMDYKLPGSGMEDKMCLDNFSYLEAKDTVKFVCGSRTDLEKAQEIIETYNLTEKCHVYLSPVFGRIEPDEMVEFMKEKKLNGVNLQLQLHKFIWSPDERGV